MAVELKFSKTNSSTPWGFRLVGGAEFDQPLVVVKVNENSVAENAGLEEGDVVVRINDTPTAGMTHVQAHDLLISAGLNFILGVRKGAINVNNLINVEDDYESAFADLVRDINESVQQDVINEAAEIVNRDYQIPNRNGINENLAGQEQMMCTEVTEQTNIFNKSLIHGIKKDKKWSTFLMKPDQPIPQTKSKMEKEKLRGEEYKVVIKKQPRKRFVPPEKKVQFDVVEVQIIDEPFEDSSSVATASTDGNDANEMENHEGQDILEKNHNEENAEDDYARLSNDGYEETVGNFDESLIKHDSLDLLFKPISEIKVDEETSTTLEEQLRAVQKQLQALSQLPSAVQTTLDAVSKQLADIVGAKEDQISENGEDLDKLEEVSDNAEAEAEAYQDHLDDTISSTGDDLEEDIITDEIRAIMERSERDYIEDEVETVPFEEDIEAKLKEEEQQKMEEEARKQEEEEIRQEEERLAKKEKEMEGPASPIQRPIILPGGRKWSNPEDAIPIFRKPRMSEEKIIETIENNLETIAGKRKGLPHGTNLGLGQIKPNQSTGIVGENWDFGMQYYKKAKKRS